MNVRSKISEFLRFVLVGLTATGVHYCIYYLLIKHIDYNLSYTIGYLLALIMNFYLTAFFTFKEKPSWKNFSGMAGAHGINYLLHIALLNIFLFLGLSKNIAPFPVFAIAVPVNFILVRFVFKYKKGNDKS